MEVRIKFEAVVYIEADDMREVVRKWACMPLFSDEARLAGADFCEIVSVEDANTFEDMGEEFNRPWD